MMFPGRSPADALADMDSPTTTFALLVQAKGGDEQALSLFERHRRRLAVLIHYKLSPHAREFCEVEDLVQETCLRAFRDIASFTYQSPGMSCAGFRRETRLQPLIGPTLRRVGKPPISSVASHGESLDPAAGETSLSPPMLTNIGYLADSVCPSRP